MPLPIHRFGITVVCVKAVHHRQGVYVIGYGKDTTEILHPAHTVDDLLPIPNMEAVNGMPCVFVPQPARPATTANRNHYLQFPAGSVANPSRPNVTMPNIARPSVVSQCTGPHDITKKPRHDQPPNSSHTGHIGIHAG